MELSDRVRIRREELRLTQDELARKMGYKSRVSINKIENGRPVSQKIIVRLADALGVSVPYLMGWDGENGYNKEKPTVYDGLSEGKRELIQFAQNLPEDKADLALRLLKSIVEGE